MVQVGGLRCGRELLGLLQWCLQPKIEDRPYPEQVFRYIDEHTVCIRHGELQWLPGTPPPCSPDMLNASLEVRPHLSSLTFMCVRTAHEMVHAG